jgi:hypothetical protein
MQANDWAMRLGQRHSARDSGARLTSDAARQAATDDAYTALTRWPRIVEGMMALVATYNEGAGRNAIGITEDRSSVTHPMVVLRGTGDNAPGLTVMLEGSAIYARSPGSGNASGETEYRLDSDRSDDATAAYVLQHWMAQL